MGACCKCFESPTRSGCLDLDRFLCLERTWGRVGWFRRCLGGRFGQDFDVMERLREVLGLARAMYKKLCGTHQMRLLPILA